MSTQDSTTIMTKKAAAIQYAKQGFAVLPVRANGKAPATEHGFKDATTGLDQIAAWWDENPGYNIGIATGSRNGFDVLDLDPRHGGDESWGALREAHLEVKELKAPFVKTPSGGVHFYFKHSDGVTTSRGSLPPGIDIRGAGGFIVAPPSEINGRSYEWGSIPFDLDTLPEWPAVLLELIRRPSSNGRRSESIPEAIPEGERNDTMFREAERLHRFGLTPPGIRAFLAVRNQDCETPLHESELEKIAASASRYPARAVAKADLPQFPVEVIPEPARSYVVAASEAIGCPPDMVAVPLLAFAGAAIGKTRSLAVKSGWEEFPVLWLAVVAPPGSAKTPALMAAQRPLNALQRAAKQRYDAEHAEWEANRQDKDVDNPGPAPRMAHFWTADATPEALASLLDASDGIVITQDELIGFVKGFDRYRTKESGERQRMLSTWSSAPWKIDRKTSGSLLIENPIVCITGGVQPDVLPELSGEAGRRDGFIERFLFAVPSVKPMKWSDRSVDEATEAAVVERFKALPFRPRPIGGVTVDRHRLRMSEDAKTRWIEWFNDQSRHTAAASGLMAGVLSKSINHTARMMLILQVLEDPSSREITLNTFEKAVKLIDYFLAHTAYVLGVIEPSRRLDRVLTILQESGDWMPTTDITNATGRHLYGQTLQGILSDLEEQGLIERRELPTAGRTRTEWRVVEQPSPEENDLSDKSEVSEERVVEDAVTP